MAEGSNKSVGRHSAEGQLAAKKQKQARAKANLQRFSKIQDFDIDEPAPVAPAAPEAEPVEPVTVESAPKASAKQADTPEDTAEITVKPEAKSEPEVAAEATVEAEPEAVAEAEPEPEPETVAEVEPEATAEVEPESEPEVEAEAESGLEQKSEPESESEPEAEEEPEPVSESELEPELEPETETAQESESEPESTPVVAPTPEPEEETSKLESAKSAIKSIAKKATVPVKSTSKSPSLYRRIYFAIFGISVLVCLLAIMLVSSIYKADVADEIGTMLESEVTLVKSTVRGDAQDVMRLTNLQMGGINLTLIGGDGTVLYDNQNNIADVPNQLEQPEVQEAINEGAGSSEHVDETTGSIFVYRALRLDNGSVVRLGSEREGFTAQNLRETLFAVLVGVAAVLVSMILAKLAATRLMDPIFDIDPENPDRTPSYLELEDLTDQIAMQKDLLGTPKSVDLHQVALSVAQRLRPAAKDAGIKLTCSGKATMLEGMPHMLDILVYNLCENAVLYSSEGAKIRVLTYVDNDRAVLKVEDTGAGISQEDLEHIFDREFQTELGKEVNPTGSGLGLSVVSQVVDVHAADIEVESEEGMGTTVVVSFPQKFEDFE